jgi:hypothetical protein
VEYILSPTLESIEAVVQNIQVCLLFPLFSPSELDNQIRDTPYPVVISPTFSGLDVPFFKVSLVKDQSQRSINYIHYFAVGLQEFDVMVDGVFLFQLSEFVAEVKGLYSKIKIDKFVDYVEKRTGSDIELDVLFGNKVNMAFCFLRLCYRNLCCICLQEKRRLGRIFFILECCRYTLSKPT